MKVWIVIELHKENVPKIIGAFSSKKKAEAVAYANDAKGWRNVVEQNVQ